MSYTLESWIIVPSPPAHCYFFDFFSTQDIFILSLNSLKRRIKKTENDVVEESERGEEADSKRVTKKETCLTLSNEKPLFLSFLVLNCVGNMCLFVEKNEKSVVFSLTYKY